MRVHRNHVAVIRPIMRYKYVECEFKKIAGVIALRKRILVYSAINRKANIPPLYSVLNPETSSLSLSAWSNGVRFVSARMENNQISSKGGTRIAKNRGCLRVFLISKVLKVIIALRRVKVMGIS